MGMGRSFFTKKEKSFLNVKYVSGRPYLLYFFTYTANLTQVGFADNVSRENPKQKKKHFLAVAVGQRITSIQNFICVFTVYVVKFGFYSKVYNPPVTLLNHNGLL